MNKLYRWLLFLYPADYRSVFGAEMAEMFDEMHAAACQQGTWRLLTFCLRELTGLVRAASHAQIRIHRTVLWAERMKTIAGGRAIVTALILALVANVAAIEMLKSFVLHRHRAQPMLSHEILPAVLAQLILVCGGVVGWVIAFLLGRTGIQRLANTDTESMRR